MEQPDLLQDLEEEIYLERASTGLRFVNFLIDLICAYALTFIAGIILGIFLIITAKPGEPLERPSTWVYYLIVIVVWLGYYTVLEGATKGRSIGKLATGTKVMQTSGANITWKDAFYRSLSRLVPFEWLSGFGTPWHDSWTNTMVIKIRK